MWNRLCFGVTHLSTSCCSLTSVPVLISCWLTWLPLLTLLRWRHQLFGLWSSKWLIFYDLSLALCSYSSSSEWFTIQWWVKQVPEPATRLGSQSDFRSQMSSQRRALLTPSGTSVPALESGFSRTTVLPPNSVSKTPGHLYHQPVAAQISTHEEQLPQNQHQRRGIKECPAAGRSLCMAGLWSFPKIQPDYTCQAEDFCRANSERYQWQKYPWREWPGSGPEEYSF